MTVAKKEDVLFSIGGDCPGGIPFTLVNVWDVSKDQFWGTVVLEVYEPDERHARYWPQIAVRLIWQEMVRRGKHIKTRIPRAEVHQFGYQDFSIEACWLSQLDSEKLTRALRVLEARQNQKRLDWNPSDAEVSAFREQDRALSMVCAQLKRLSDPKEIGEVPHAPMSLEAENAMLRSQLEALTEKHNHLVNAVLSLRT